MQVARMPSAVVRGGTRPDRGGCPPEFRRRLVLQSWSHSDGPALPRVPAGFSPAFWRMWGNPVRPAGETKAGYAAAVRDYAEVL